MRPGDVIRAAMLALSVVGVFAGATLLGGGGCGGGGGGGMSVPQSLPSVMAR
jgi:hypothetical protein